MCAQVQEVTNIIFAAGRVGGDGSLQYHLSTRSGGQVNFATGLAAIGQASGNQHYNHMLWVGPMHPRQL